MTRSLAGIQYAGEAGISQSCIDAVTRILQHGDRILHARLLSSNGRHGLLLSTSFDDLVAVKSGFGSGYRGEGSRALSRTLALLNVFGADIDEYEVPRELIERLDGSALTGADMDMVDAAHPVRPTRWWDYLFAEHQPLERTPRLFDVFQPVIPFAIIDGRLIDLAISFWEAPDDKLLTGYRRLEDIVRARTGTNEYGAKLFSLAFQGNTSKLHWVGVDGGEQTGRASLFTGAYMAYRNARAHREIQTSASEDLAEFMLLNHLYALEAQAVPRGDA